MISTLNQIKTFAVAVFLLLVPMGSSVAQETLTLSVTPPLFQISASPAQSWQSALKIINTNDFPLVLYAEPVNFAPVGEAGRGSFIPIADSESQGQTLAEWISITNEQIMVPPEESYELPFSINVPDEPPPGGHFAAILIRTNPPSTESNPLAIRTSQVVSSLVFLQISGDIVEQARIREFSVEDYFLETPEANFELRFENTGNVNIRPQGNIEITNMWGKQRGVIPINQVSNFGNVLPGSIRKFDFTWRGDSSLADIGRYRAVLVLSFGGEARQNVTQTITFWVVPLKPLAAAVAGLVLLIWLIRRAVRSYVRHMLLRAGIDPDERQRTKQSGDVAMYKRISKAGAQPESDTGARDTRFDTLVSFIPPVIVRYWFFVLGIPSIMLFLSIGFWYLSNALAENRSYEVTVDSGAGEQRYNSEEAALEQISESEKTDTNVNTNDQGYLLEIVNATDIVGGAAEVALLLEANGYDVSAIRPELDTPRKRTVVVPSPSLISEARSISEALGGVLVSVDTSYSDSEKITVYVGEDVPLDN